MSLVKISTYPRKSFTKIMATLLTEKVLMANGQYKSMHNVLAGDRVIGLQGKPVLVKKVIHEKATKLSLTIEVKHDNWHKFVPLKADTEVLVWNKEARKPYWIQSEYYTEDAEQSIVMPLPLKWDIVDTFEISYGRDDEKNIIKPSYPLGFIFGTYLKIGNIIDNTVSFHCDTSTLEVVHLLRRYMKELFPGLKENTTTSTYYHDVYYTDPNDELCNLFKKFKIGDKRLPYEFLCSDFEYIKGIHFGMMFTGTTAHFNYMTNSVRELSYMTSYIMGKPAHFGQLKFYHEGRNILATRSSLFGLNRKKRDFIWLEVDASDGAYFVNNMIVRPH